VAGPTIAIDARLVGYAAGIAYYAMLLVEALEKLEGPERYVVLHGRRAPHRLGRLCWTPPHHRLERWTLPVELLASGKRLDLLHSIDHVAPAWGPWRTVVTLHDLAFLLYPETHTPASRGYYAAAGESARRAARVIAVSQRTASDAVRLLGVDPARMRVIHNAADPRFFRPHSSDEVARLSERLRFDLRKPYILFVGTLEPRKNVPLLFEALARLRRHVDLHLLVVGGRGWLDRSIQTAYARSGVGDAARFLGWLDQSDLAVLYGHAGVFALPSVYEGFGLPVLEAMACGAPVVCSNAGPLPEVAGDAAVVLAPDDAGTWAEAIGRVLSDASLAAELRARGARRAREFSWDKAARVTREVYREALLA
jgi:glycosyltransferase involved in cell wall biosynthesis